MKLSKNFKLWEFVRSRTAAKKGIDNTPGEQEIRNIKDLVVYCIQPACDLIQMTLDPGDEMFIRVNSGYRCDELNKAIGGSPRSFHRFAMAADLDLIINGEEQNAILYRAFLNLQNFTELVWEYGDDQNPAWVHVAFSKNDSRRMVKRRPNGLPIIT